MRTNEDDIVSIYRNIEDWLKNRGYEYVDESANTDIIIFTVRMGSYSATVTYDRFKNTYTFSMPTGRVKVSKDLKTLIENFDSYYHINLVVVPHAKRVADSFEVVLGIKTVFDNFVGNSTQGYAIKFVESGNKSRGIRIKEVSDEVYHASYVEYDGEGSYVVLHEADYKVEGNECYPVDESFSLKDLSDGEVAVYNDEEESLTISNDSVFLLLKQSGDDISLVEGNYGLSRAKGVVILSRTVEDIINECISKDIWEPIHLYADIKKYLTKDNVMAIGDTEYKVRSRGETIIINTGKHDVEINTCEELGFFIQSLQPAQSIEAVLNDAQKCDIATDESTEIKLVCKDDDIVAVRFINQDGIFDVDPDIIKNAGLDLERIQGVSKLFTKNGIIITDDERRLKKFSRKVTEEDKILKLIDSLFN